MCQCAYGEYLYILRLRIDMAPKFVGGYSTGDHDKYDGRVQGHMWGLNR